MSHREEEWSRMRRRASRQAVALAMEGKWREAIAVNRSITEMFSRDVEAYNRLGRAHMELGEYSLAEEAYRRTVEIDPYNAIAQKNLQRLARLKQTATGAVAGADRIDPQSFIEEVGKAGVVQLVDLGPPVTVARTVAGDRVELRVSDSTVVVESLAGEYLGRLAPEHGQRLARLAQGGNRYSAAIVSSTENAVSVIIREVYQHPSQAGRASFPVRGVTELRSDISDRVLRRELEQEEGVDTDSGYTVVGAGEDRELLVQDTEDDDGEDGEEE